MKSVCDKYGVLFILDEASKYLVLRKGQLLSPTV